MIELGSGGMGSVILARAAGPGDFERLVALKRMRPGLIDSDELRMRFTHEARLAGCVRHANVVGVHDFGPWESFRSDEWAALSVAGLPF